LDERIAMGRDLMPSSHGIGSDEDLKSLRDQYYTWDEYNQAWLERNVGSTIAEEYASRIPIAFIGGAPEPLPVKIRDFDRDVQRHVRRLGSIRERLHLWVDDTREGRGDAVDTDGPIFVVHGRDEGKAQYVARVLERGTGRDVTILHEQPNQGRTLIEKFEHHALRASFAVVVLTGDDEGGLAGSEDRRQRGRQNVIFELGFFFGLLGRGRVVVLTMPEVEKPSDVDGLVYIPWDGAGAWKQDLARELEAAKIAVNRGRMP
jgi:hypothetical protein